MKRREGGRSSKDLPPPVIVWDRAASLNTTEKKIETKDRRKKNYVELNRATGQTDVKGNGIFENDLIHDKEENQICRVEYCEKYAAFVAVASILNFNFPLTFLDKRNQKFEIVGNIYEGLKNGKK